MTSLNPNSHKLRVAFLISGNGSTLAAILTDCKNCNLSKVEPVLIVASTKDAGGIAKAKGLGFPEKDILVIDPKNFSSREEFGQAIVKECLARQVELIGQYGWMIKTPDNVIEAYKNKIINQHPGPLDSGRSDFGGAGMYGLRVHLARLEFVRRTGHDFWTEATSHFVTSNFDEGAILRKKQMQILPNDTAEKMQTNLLPYEHEVQIETLRDFSEGHVTSFVREKPLIEKSELKILEECKELAKKAYPNG